MALGRLLGIAVAVALAVLVAAPGAGAATPPCQASGLVVWAGEEPGGGAAGSVYYRIEFTNLSGHPCEVSAYPTVSAVDLKGRRIGSPAGQAPGKKAKPVKLAEGDTATATLQIVDALNFPTSECKPTWAAGLRITVPGGVGSKVAPLAFQTCALTAAETLSVGVVSATD
jgi:Protein of unknown function (DUF4232)